MRSNSGSVQENAATRCRQSSLVHVNCDQCGQRPDIIHKPADRRGECYCGDCCPACRGKKPVEKPA